MIKRGSALSHAKMVESDRVSFEIEQGAKGPSALKVKKL
jgi:cold shock CspA family protein